MIMPCPKCACDTDEADNFCRRCGKPLRTGTGFFYTHSGIILLTLAAGPFALITLWLSKLISTPAKWIYTAFICAFTFYLGLAFYRAMMMIEEAFNYALQGGF